MHHWERRVGLYTQSDCKWNSETGKAKGGEREAEIKRQGTWKEMGTRGWGGGEEGGMLMEEAETKKGTDFRVAAAAEEE